MKITKLLTGIIALFFLLGCNDSKEKIYSELEKFDNSLDSLITEKTYSNPKYLILIGDTIKNNPKQIEEIDYLNTGNDSLLVDANCHVYKFKNNQLITNASEDVLGRKYVQKYVLFKDKIDNKLIQTLRDEHTDRDTIFFGSLEKYDKNGRLVKQVTSSVWRELDKASGLLVTKENRTLDVYKYNTEKSIYTTFRKSYFNKKYDIDSLRAVPVEKFDTEIKKKNKVFEYSYIYDNHGNWIVRRDLNTQNPSVKYRKITYK